YQVVIIDKRNYHTFQPLLYQASTSGLDTGSIVYPLRKTVKKQTPHAFFRYAHVQKIETENKKIIADIGELTSDYSVNTSGSKTNFFGKKSIEKHAMRMKSAPQALNIRSLILENFEEATITRPGKKREALLNFVIVGGGPTGVELSGAIAEVRNNII